jgi:hypothetical protein
MSSVLARTKQIPTDGQYFISILPTTQPLPLLVLLEDPAASTTSYVSGALAGRFQTSNVTLSVPTDASGTLSIFRDMGQTLMSSGRTFRGVQLLALDGNKTTGAGGYGWTSAGTTNPGVWQPSNEGVTGNPVTTANTGGSFQTYFFETGARGLGIAQGLVRYG